MLHSDVDTLFIRVASRQRRQWLAALAAAALSLWLPAVIALAGPVAPDEVRLTQPDGTVLVARPFGDEWYSGYEHKGLTIVLDPRSGYWVYAQQDQDGRLAPGSRKAGIEQPPADLEPGLRDSQALRAIQDEESLAPDQAWGGAMGTQKVLVLLVDFTPSVSLGTTDAQWNQLFFDSTAGTRSVINWFDQASFGKFGVAPVAETYGTANDGVIAVTLGYAHPNSYPIDDNNRLISKNALIAADPYIDYSSLDTNGNGALDVTEVHIMVIVRGFETAYGGLGVACSPGVWGHRSSLSGSVPAPQLDGVWVAASSYDGGYTQEGEWHEYISDGCDGSTPGHMATMGIMVHEMGHDIDWPDLYDTDGSSAGVGYWSVMGNGSWGRASSDAYSGQTPVLPDAFLKWYQHWLTPVQVALPQASVALPNSAQNAVAYLVGANPGGVDWDYRNVSGTGEYFLIENRQQVGFDAGLYRIDGNATGCLIWHINETITYTNAANATEAHKLVDVEEADGAPQDLDLGANYGDSGDPWPGTSGETAFNASSNPGSDWYTGLVSGIAVINMSTATTGCTVDFSSLGPMWIGKRDTDWNTTANWTVGRVPNQNDLTFIPSGTKKPLILDVAATVFSLNILDGACLTATAAVSLEVYGDWTEHGSGYFAGSAGTVVFRGTQPQSITVGAGSHFNHLQIGSGSTKQTVTTGSDLDVNGNLEIRSGATLAAGSRTIRFGGDWTDSPLGFAPGSGTVILNGTTQTIQRAASELLVYSNDLSSTAGWKIYDANGGGFWGYSTSIAAPNSPDHGLHVRYQYSASLPADDWVFSPGFTLQAGVTYSIRFNYGAYNASYPEKLEVKIGTAQAVAAMTTQVFDNSNVTNTTWQEGSGTFTPGGSGTYYVGFHCYSPADRRYPAVDDLVVAAPDPDVSFYNLSLVGGTAALGSNAAVQNNLSVAAGVTLALGAYDMTIGGVVTNNGAMVQTRSVNAASTSLLNLKNAAETVDKYLGVTIDPGGSNMGSTTATIWGNQLCPGAFEGVKRCFELDPTTPQAATVTLYYTEAERNGTAPATMRVYHWNGTAWELEAGTTTRGGSGDGLWARVTGVDAYSPFALHNVWPTAVTLLGFDARAIEDGSVMLEWQTATEVDLAGFYVYRAESEAEPLVRLTENLIPSHSPGSPAGDSYAFRDQTAVRGKTYNYWLEALKIGGASERYGPVRVAVEPGTPLVLHLPLVNCTR